MNAKVTVAGGVRTKRRATTSPDQLRCDETAERSNDSECLSKKNYTSLLLTRFPETNNHFCVVINASTRTILVDWICRLCTELQFPLSVYHSAITYLDMYMSIVDFQDISLYQLVGLTCAWISTKFHLDDKQLSIDNMKEICLGTYERAQFLEMEREILCVLDFNLSVPSLYERVVAYCMLINASSVVQRFLIAAAEKYTMDGSVVRIGHLALMGIIMSRL